MKLSMMLPVAGLVAATVALAVPADEPPEFLLKWGSWGTGPGQFRDPFGVATDSQGNVYVADNLNNRIEKFTSSGTLIRMWGEVGHNPGQFTSPTGVAISSDDLVYVCDASNGRIEVFTDQGVYINQWSVVTGSDGIAASIGGVVYVSATAADAMAKYSQEGAFLLAWGSSGSGPGQFIQPVGIAVDQQGHVYVADTGNGRIQKFESDGTYLAEWPARVIYLAIDASGNVYGGARNPPGGVKFSPSGDVLAQWGSTGTGDGEFLQPTGIALDVDGNVFIADAFPLDDFSRIQKFGQVPVATAPTTWGSIKSTYR